MEKTFRNIDRNFNKSFMPIAIDVNDKKVLLIGGGKVAMHKIDILLQYANHIEVVALEIDDELKRKVSRWQEKAYQESDLDGSVIVYACTNIKELNAQVKADAAKRNILVNVVDNPAECDFVSPAIYKRNFVSVAVSSNARNVYKAIEVRNKIKEHLDHDSTLFD